MKKDREHSNFSESQRRVVLRDGVVDVVTAAHALQTEPWDIHQMVRTGALEENSEGMILCSSIMRLARQRS